MSTINYTYNVIVDRFRQFAAGHFQLRRFTHGEISQADLEKEAEWPWLHVKPRAINYSPGTRAFSFEIFISDLPRDKEDKTGYQAESITDCSLIFQDLINEIYLGNMFGSDVVLTRPVSSEPFVEQYTHTLTGVTGTIELSLDYDWSACSIPASWNYNTPTDSGSDGWGALQFIDSLNQNGAYVSLDNDVEAPGNSYYYGTDASGVKGWHVIEASGITCEDLPECATIISILDDIAALQTDVALKANTADLGATAFSNDYNDLDNLPTIPSLTGYVPYTGATDNVDLGSFNITADHIALNVSPSGPGYVVGATEWNNTIGSSQTLLKGGNVSLKNGVDLVARIVNKVSPNTTLTKAAYQAVRISGAQGGRLAVALAQANNDSNSADTIGIVCETIATNQEGFILTVGQLENINTTGSLQGETWVDGDVLYLSPTTAGALTNIKPTGATGHIVVVGYVEYAHANNGSIYVKVMNGWELDELHNVYISSPTDNQALIYESASSLWKNETVDKTFVGLGNVDNTSDANKPVSSATQTALNLKENSANKQNSLAVDGTGVKFPTVDAVNTQSMIDKGKRMLSFFYDFVGPISSLDAIQTSTSGGIVSIIPGASIPNRTNQQGVAYYGMQTASTNYAAHISNSVIQLWFGGGAWNFESSINLNSLSTSLERFRTVHGFGSNTNNAIEADGAFITYDEGGTSNGTIASPNWQCVTVANNVRTLTTTSTPVTANAWNKLRVEVNAAGTSVAFYVNGTLIATHTTNIPLGSASRFIIMKHGMFKTIGTTNRVMYVDYLGYENILTTPR